MVALRILKKNRIKQPARAISENKRLVADAMMEMHQKGMKPLVVIDEGQDLPVSMLNELRYVLNYRTDSFSPLMVILSGAPRLAETLRLQVLEPKAPESFYILSPQHLIHFSKIQMPAIAHIPRSDPSASPPAVRIIEIVAAVNT